MLEEIASRNLFFSISSRYIKSDVDLNNILMAILNNTFDGGSHQNRLQKI